MVNRDRIVREFQELVAIDARSFRERKMADRLTEKLREIGFSVEEDDSGRIYGGSAGNIYGFLAGDLPGDPLLFSAHMDTVEPALRKKAIVGEDGTIRSAGTTVLGADDVAGLVEILEGVRHLEEERIPHRDIEVLFPIAEEPYVKGSTVFDYSKIKAKEAYVLDLSGSPGTASTKEPTLMSFEIVVHGKSGHAAYAAEEGISAIRVAVDALASVPQGRLDEDSTVNIGTITGGTVTNVIPDYCRVTGEIRCFNHEKAMSIYDRICSAFEEHANGAVCEPVMNLHLLAYKISEEHPVIRRFQSACRRLGLPGDLIYTFGGSDNNSFVRHGITGLDISCGMNKIHTTEEYTTVDDLVSGAELVAEILKTTEFFEGEYFPII